MSLRKARQGDRYTDNFLFFIIDDIPMSKPPKRSNRANRKTARKTQYKRLFSLDINKL